MASIMSGMSAPKAWHVLEKHNMTTPALIEVASELEGKQSPSTNHKKFLGYKLSVTSPPADKCPPPSPQKAKTKTLGGAEGGKLYLFELTDSRNCCHGNSKI